MRRRHVLLTGAAAAASFLVPSLARAASEQQEIIEKARLTAESMLADPNHPTLRQYLPRARGVMVFPSLLKGGFVIGAEGGTGVLLARGKDGAWSYPAFYTVGAASVGLQVGFQDSQVIFLIMTERGLRAIMHTEVKLGADASIAAGPVGTGVEGATTTAFNADIVSFAKTSGLFAGLSFEGAVVKGRDSHNISYYGRGATAQAILVDQSFSNREADGLRRALTLRN